MITTSAANDSPFSNRTPVARLRLLSSSIDDTDVDKRYVTPMRSPTLISASITVWKPPLGYQIPSANSVYWSKEYVPGASKGDIPIYMLPKVKTRRRRSVQKYFDALE